MVVVAVTAVMVVVSMLDVVVKDAACDSHATDVDADVDGDKMLLVGSDESDAR